MLNGTLCATQRTLCCILENYQTDKGVRVPEVLQALVGTDFIPYTEKFLEEYRKKEEKELAKGDKKKGGNKKEEKKEAESTEVKTNEVKTNEVKTNEVKVE